MSLIQKLFPNRKTAPKTEQKKSLFHDAKDILYILVAFLLIYCLFFRIVVVDGTSMNMTLLDGDKVLLLSSTTYRNPKRGDIIVFSRDDFQDGECVVKRVIAVAGQEVDIDFESRTVFVDGQALEESYVYFAENDNRPMIQEGMKFPLTVDKGCVFVMGDNRNNSHDSRSPDIGLVDCREILGRAFFLILPGTNLDTMETDYSRIGFIHE